MSVGQEIAIDVLMENFLAKLSNSDAIIIFAQFWKFESHVSNKETHNYLYLIYRKYGSKSYFESRWTWFVKTFYFCDPFTTQSTKENYQVREQQNIFTHRNKCTQEKNEYLTYVNNKHNFW